MLLNERQLGMYNARLVNKCQERFRKCCMRNSFVAKVDLENKLCRNLQLFFPFGIIRKFL